MSAGPANSAAARRKQVCNGCRSRKKRCDAAQPVCLNCRKWGIVCDYTTRHRTSQTFINSAPRPLQDDDSIGAGAEYMTWDLGATTTFFPSSGISTDASLRTDGFSSASASRLQGPEMSQNGDQADMFQGITASSAANSFPGFFDEAHETIIDQFNSFTTDVPAVADSSSLYHAQTRSDGSNLLPNSGDGDPMYEVFPPTSASLPDETRLTELVNLFFDRCHHFLPFLHKSKCLDAITSIRDPLSTNGQRNSALLYAIISMAARYHPDPATRSREEHWFDEAKKLYEKDQDVNPHHPSLQYLQAGLCILLQSSLLGKYALAWLFIGRVWRQVCTLGFNRIDTEQLGILGAATPPRNAFEKEERRRTAWALFVIDRGMAFPYGWPHTIDDRQFFVNLPVDDNLFQMADDTTPELAGSLCFGRNLREMIMRTPEGGQSTTRQQYILKAYVVLGRATEHVHALHASSDPEEYFREFCQLDSDLSRFKLSLPSHTTTISSAVPQETAQVVWLNAILNTITILLHHSADARSVASSASSAGSAPTSQSYGGTSFMHCVTAARTMSRLIQEATKVSVNVLLNPFISSSFYLCGRILTIEWYTTKDESVRADMEIFLLVFDRMEEVYPLMGAKLKRGMHYNMQQAEEGASKMRKEGARAFLAKCREWSG